jgi:hypothetical protein
MQISDEIEGLREMTVEFINDDFLLTNQTAKRLYHEHAEKMPLYDFHCHLPAEKIAADHQYENITQMWIASLQAMPAITKNSKNGLRPSLSPFEIRYITGRIWN